MIIVTIMMKIMMMMKKMEKRTRKREIALQHLEFVDTVLGLFINPANPHTTPIR